jgi:molecular chaperone HscB
MAQCWNCQGAAADAGFEAHFCPGCGKIQPRPDPRDLYGFFGLPPRYAVDGAELEARYHELSRKLHPDRFTRATARERRLSMEKTTDLNRAVRTLRDPIQRAAYLLAREGRALEETRRADPAFLMEVMETRERIAELKAEGEAGLDELGRLERGFAEKDAASLEGIAERFARIDDGLGGDERASVLDEIADLLDRHKYHQGILAELRGQPHPAGH